MTEWIECTLDKLGEIVGGATPSTKCEDYYGGSIPWITPKDLSSFKGRYITSGERNITEKGLASCSAQMMPKDAVLFTSRAPIGYVAIASQSVCTNQGFKSIVVNEKADPLFVYYLLKYNKDAIEAMGSGTTFKEVSGKTMRAVKVRIPVDVSYQKRIAAVLDSLDTKIENNERINDNLYEIVNAYYTSLFKDVECEMTTIGNYAERIYSGGTPTTSNAAYWDGTFGWFSSGETRNRFVISTEKSITQTGIDNSSTKLASKHDIVMASAGQGFTRGQTSMLLIDTYVNQSVIVIHADRNILPYLFWNLANRYEELRAISDSSSIRGSLTTKMIAAFEIPCANNDVIQTFSGFAWAVIPQIENNLLENERLAALRDSLLPKLMTGEIDVSAIQL